MTFYQRNSHDLKRETNGETEYKKLTYNIMHQIR